MKVTVSAATKMFLDMGFKAADEWDRETLELRVNNLRNAVDEDNPLEGESLKVQQAVLKAQKNGDPIVLVDLAAPAEKGAKSAAIKTISRKKNKPAGLAKRLEEKVVPRKSDQMKAKNGEGVIDYIQSIYRKATEDKPLAKETALEMLQKKFQDRDRKSMLYTLNAWVPTRLTKRRGQDVRKKRDKMNRTAHWIVGTLEGFTPTEKEPMNETAPKAAKKPKAGKPKAPAKPAKPGKPAKAK